MDPTQLPLDNATSAGLEPIADQSEDQALAADTVDATVSGSTAVTVEARLGDALSQAWSELAAAASSTDFHQLLIEVYGSSSSDSDAFSQAATALATRLAGGDQLGLRYEIESGEEMGGANGAYAVVGDDGVATIYINGDWLKSATAEELRLVLLEEIGHSFDVALNGAVDTTGDEGELFARLFSGETLSEEQRAAIQAEDDSATLVIDGQAVAVEEAVSGTNGVVINTSNVTVNKTNGTLVSYTVTVTTANNNGADLLVGAYNSQGSLIGWQIVNRASNLDADTTASYTGSFNFANANLDPVATSSITFRAWQGTAGTTYGTGSDTTPVITYGKSTTLSGGAATGFAINSNNAAAGTPSLSLITPTAGSQVSASSSNITVDTIAPSVTITDSDANTVNIADGTVTFTFTFNESVTGFTSSKITVGNGTQGTFSGSGAVYTLVVTPTAGTAGNITIDVDASGVADLAGNSATPLPPRPFRPLTPWLQP